VLALRVEQGPASGGPAERGLALTVFHAGPGPAAGSAFTAASTQRPRRPAWRSASITRGEQAPRPA